MSDQNISQRLKTIAALYSWVGWIAYIFPFIPKYFVNKVLAQITGYKGRAEGVYFSPFSMNIRLKGLVLDIIDEQTRQKYCLLSAQEIVISMNKKSFSGGEIQGAIKIIAPTFTFSNSSAKAVKDNMGSGNPLYSMNAGVNITIQDIEIQKGKIIIIDSSVKPEVMIEGNNISLAASDIHIAKNADYTFPAKIYVSADICEGRIDAKMEVKLQSRMPDFYLEAGVRDIKMPCLNNAFLAYGGFDIHKGIMTMHSEITAKDGRFKGYVESLISDLEMRGPEDNHDSLAKRLREILIGGVMDLLEDHSTDELNTKIKFDKSFKNPEVHILLAVLEVLANALVHGLSPYTKNKVQINL